MECDVIRFQFGAFLQATRTSTSTVNTSQSGPIPASFGPFGIPAEVHIQTIPATNIGKLLQP